MMQKMLCRVPFGIISSTFLLAATNDHHLKNCYNEVSETIRKNIYVDSGDRDSGRPKRLAPSTDRDRIREKLSNEQNH